MPLTENMTESFEATQQAGDSEARCLVECVHHRRQILASGRVPASRRQVLRDGHAGGRTAKRVLKYAPNQLGAPVFGTIEMERSRLGYPPFRPRRKGGH